MLTDVAPRTRSWIALGVVLAAASAPAFFVLPAGDDWGTIRPPRELSVEWFRAGVFFRPLHQALLLVGRVAPHGYEAFLHTVTLLGHVASAGLVFSIVAFRGARRLALPSASGFALFPGCAAAIWSLDSATQTWSTACGLAALATALRGGRFAVTWPLFAFAAALWKESGLAWFAAVPLAFSLLRRDDDPRARRSWLGVDARTFTVQLRSAVAALAAYWLLRWAFSLEFRMGDSAGRYALGFDPLRWLVNLAQLLTVTLTPVDTLAVFGTAPSPLWASLSVAFGFPLLAVALYALFRRSVRHFLGAGVLLVVVASPHLFIGHVSEMYAHPLAAVVAILGADALAASSLSARWLHAAFASFLVASLGVSAHKAVGMIETGHGARDVALRILEQLPNGARPQSVCAVPHAGSAERGYSVFDLPPGRASGFGQSLLSEWRWAAPERFLLRHDVAACHAERTELVIVFRDEATPVVERGATPR